MEDAGEQVLVQTDVKVEERKISSNYPEGELYQRVATC
jgi:hypothetical protein